MHGNLKHMFKKKQFKINDGRDFTSENKTKNKLQRALTGKKIKGKISKEGSGDEPCVQRRQEIPQKK